jgi:hypothetical protein
MMIDRTVLKRATEATVAGPSADRVSSGRAASGGKAESRGRVARGPRGLDFRSPIVIGAAVAIVLVSALLVWFAFGT